MHRSITLAAQQPLGAVAIGVGVALTVGGLPFVDALNDASD